MPAAPFVVWTGTLPDLVDEAPPLPVPLATPEVVALDLPPAPPVALAVVVPVSVPAALVALLEALVVAFWSSRVSGVIQGRRGLRDPGTYLGDGNGGQGEDDGGGELHFDGWVERLCSGIGGQASGR